MFLGLQKVYELLIVSTLYPGFYRTHHSQVENVELISTSTIIVMVDTFLLQHLALTILIDKLSLFTDIMRQISTSAKY